MLSRAFSTEVVLILHAYSAECEQGEEWPFTLGQSMGILTGKHN